MALKEKGTKVHDMVNASIEYDNLFVTLFLAGYTLLKKES